MLDTCDNRIMVGRYYIAFNLYSVGWIENCIIAIASRAVETWAISVSRYWQLPWCETVLKIGRIRIFVSGGKKGKSLLFFRWIADKNMRIVNKRQVQIFRVEYTRQCGKQVSFKFVSALCISSVVFGNIRAKHIKTKTANGNKYLLKRWDWFIRNILALIDLHMRMYISMKSIFGNKLHAPRSKATFEYRDIRVT